MTSQAVFSDFFPEIALGDGPKNSPIRVKVKKSTRFRFDFDSKRAEFDFLTLWVYNLILKSECLYMNVHE